VNTQLIKKNVILAVWMAAVCHHHLVKKNATLNAKTHLILLNVSPVVWMNVTTNHHHVKNNAQTSVAQTVIPKYVITKNV